MMLFAKVQPLTSAFRQQFSMRPAIWRVRERLGQARVINRESGLQEAPPRHSLSPVCLRPAIRRIADVPDKGWTGHG